MRAARAERGGERPGAAADVGDAPAGLRAEQVDLALAHGRQVRRRVRARDALGRTRGVPAHPSADAVPYEGLKTLRLTKRPWPGRVTILPSSKTTVPRLSVCRGDPDTFWPSQRS